MKENIFKLIPLVAAALWAANGLAEDSSMSNTDSMSQPQETSTPGNQPGVAGQEDTQLKDQAKMMIAPHTVTIQTELQSAIDQVKGLRTQLQASTEKKPSADIVDHLKMHSKELNSNLQVAATHNQHLKSEASKLPVVAQSDEYKSAESAMRNAEQVNTSFQQKAKSASYWDNRKQAMNDLDNLEKNFNNAMDKSKDLASKFDIKSFS